LGEVGLALRPQLVLTLPAPEQNVNTSDKSTSIDNLLILNIGQRVGIYWSYLLGKTVGCEFKDFV
jgi:hypothetical protein